MFRNKWQVFDKMDNQGRTNNTGGKEQSIKGKICYNNTKRAGGGYRHWNWVAIENTRETHHTNLCLKDCLCTINLLDHLEKTSKFITLYLLKPVTTMNLSGSRSNLERHSYSEGAPAMQRATILKVSMGPWLPTTYGIKWNSHICISAVCLGHCHRQLLATLLLANPQGPQSDGCGYHIPTGGYGLNRAGEHILTGT